MAPYTLKKELYCPPLGHGLAEYSVSVSSVQAHRWARAVCACGTVATASGEGTYAELLDNAVKQLSCVSES